MTMSGQSSDMMAEVLPPTPQGSQILPGGSQPMFNQNPHTYLQVSALTLLTGVSLVPTCI